MFSFWTLEASLCEKKSFRRKYVPDDCGYQNKPLILKTKAFLAVPSMENH
eukprot:TRINITY_DN55_c0_g2_i14.p1 TRINITY_DN55_c0_g2~~TRINITY_DN55_c0_g2_i14.p1  ORF type:complete len:50 (-),score=6.10 TRINITY_DN55_c0_g2_i14:137-286(-)